ncbi:MAG TPA: tetratricopeptide repeat protein [Geobacteraceae bacterium]|nr:tetratricopeptide repeat protein [Geobacteraceae bacterium]
MSLEDSEKLVSKGIEALGMENHHLAVCCLERAMQLNPTPIASSYLAYGLAKLRGSYAESAAMAREALHLQPDNPLHYYNLGRILSLSGDKEQAMRILQDGLQYGMHMEILREIQSIVFRKPPVFKNLPRKHFLNKYTGLLLSRLGLR